MASRILPNIARRAVAVKSASTRCFVSATAPAFEKHTIKVPTMGDSITEGTIVEWTAQVGQMVQDGDVVALVETDKVTVDIKADIDGVITQHFGAVDDTVEVGASLYEIDTEAEATVEASVGTETPVAEAPPAPVAKSAPSPVASAAAVLEKSHHRTPSIQFLGKDGWMRRRSGETAVIYGVPSNYGRPKFTEDEMEALMLGGANLVPDVKKHSSGAVFKY